MRRCSCLPVVSLMLSTSSMVAMTTGSAPARMRFVVERLSLFSEFVVDADGCCGGCGGGARIGLVAAAREVMSERSDAIEVNAQEGCYADEYADDGCDDASRHDGDPEKPGDSSVARGRRRVAVGRRKIANDDAAVRRQIRKRRRMEHRLRAEGHYGSGRALFC